MVDGTPLKIGYSVISLVLILVVHDWMPVRIRYERECYECMNAYLMILMVRTSYTDFRIPIRIQRHFALLHESSLMHAENDTVFRDEKLNTESDD